MSVLAMYIVLLYIQSFFVVYYQTEVYVYVCISVYVYVCVCWLLMHACVCMCLYSWLITAGQASPTYLILTQLVILSSFNNWFIDQEIMVMDFIFNFQKLLDYWSNTFVVCPTFWLIHSTTVLSRTMDCLKCCSKNKNNKKFK